MQTIRRYANRKYYHLEGHRYVSLAEIAALVRSGEEVRIVQHPGGEEITAEVLAQIVAQERPAGLTAWLSTLIRLGRTPPEEPARTLLAHLGLPSQEQWRQVEQQVARLEELVQRLLDEREKGML